MISIQSSPKMDDHDVSNMFSIQDPQKWLTMILLTHMFFTFKVFENECLSNHFTK
jgi:hypothetical protein